MNDEMDRDADAHAVGEPSGESLEDQAHGDDVGLDVSVETSEALSWRAKGSLTRGGYRLMSEVAAASDEELLSLPGFGRGQLNEVRRAALPVVNLADPSFGRRRRVYLSDPSNVEVATWLRARPVAAQRLYDCGFRTAADVARATAGDLKWVRGVGDDLIAVIRREMESHGFAWPGAGIVTQTSDIKPVFDGVTMELDDVAPSMSVRLRNALRRGGMTSTAQVREASDVELLALPAFGVTSLREARSLFGFAPPSSEPSEDRTWPPVGEEGDLHEPESGEGLTVAEAEQWSPPPLPSADSYDIAEVWAGSQQVLNLIKSLGITVVADLLPASHAAVAEIHGIGWAAQELLADDLLAMGWEWAPRQVWTEYDIPEPVDPTQTGRAMGLSAAAAAELTRFHIHDEADLFSWDVAELQGLVSKLTAMELSSLAVAAGPLFKESAALSPFAEHLDALRNFVAEFGYVPGRHETSDAGGKIGQWAMWVRQQYKAGKVDAHRRWSVEQIETWSWAPPRGRTGRRLLDVTTLLERYAADRGHTTPLVNEAFEGSQAYDRAQWLRTARDQMTKALQARLDVLPGWTWDQAEAEVALEERKRALRDETVSRAWLDARDALIAYAEKRGGIEHVKTTEVDEVGRPVGHWVTAQRSHRDVLRPRQIALLEEIPGWSWNGMQVRETRAWFERAEKLLAYVKEHSTTILPTSYRTADGFWLGQWVAAQRRSRDVLNDEQAALLEGLPDWDWRESQSRASTARPETKAARDAKWEANRAKFARYFAETGKPPPFQYMEDGAALGQWVIQQRTTHRQGLLSAERVAALEATPGWVWRAERGAAARSTNFTDLLTHGFVTPGDVLVGMPPKWRHVSVTVTDDGRVSDGENTFDNLAHSLKVITGTNTYSTWQFYGLQRDEDETVALEMLREQCTALMKDRYPGT